MTNSAIEFTWPGVPVTAWASMRPSRSKTPAERSPHSRTIGLKAVRIRVCACSSTTAIRRFHMICRSIRPTLLDWLIGYSSRVLAVHDDTAGGIDVRGKTGRNIGRGLVLGDDGRPGESTARRQRLAAIDRHLGGATAAAVEHRPLADRLWRGAAGRVALPRRQLGLRRDLDRPAQDLDRGIGDMALEQRGIVALVGHRATPPHPMATSGRCGSSTVISWP